MVRAKRTPNGIELPIRVIPRAKRDEIAGERNGSVCVRITAAPVEGAANRALARLLSQQLGVPKSSIHLAAGERSRAKVLRIETPDPDAIVDRLRSLGAHIETQV